MLQAKDIRRKYKNFCAQTLFIVQIYVQKCSLMVLRADSTLPLCVNEQTCNLCSFANMWHSDTTARAQFVLRIRKRGGYRLCASMASN